VKPAAFEHRQSAHCESGVVSNMMRAAGVEMSEPMAFGLSAGLVFAYIPVVKLAGQPLIAYRTPPGWIRAGFSKRTGARWREEKFTDEREAMRALDEALAAGESVGLQTGVYWLPYIPADMRFHFNAHNLVVVGRDGDDYLISDPVLTEPQRCAAKDLQAARFARGPLAPHGKMYRLVQTPEALDYAAAIPAAIRRNSKMMLAPFLPIAGVNGIRLLGGVVEREAAKGDAFLKPLLAHIVRMQEEIGTGGAGFRFLYAAFLKEAAAKIGRDDFAQAANALTDAGDEWRRFALLSTKMCRGRAKMDAKALSGVLNQIADREEAVWRSLRKV
jgi:hypothetical protein